MFYQWPVVNTPVNIGIIEKGMLPMGFDVPMAPILVSRLSEGMMPPPGPPPAKNNPVKKILVSDGKMI